MADRIALIGSETLLGREVREVFSETSLGNSLRLVAAEGEEPGKITEIGGAAAFLAKLAPEAVEDADIVILAGAAEATRQALEARSTGVLIDLTYSTEDQPEAQIRAPMVEEPDDPADHAGPWIVAHPAAIAIAMVLQRLHRSFPVARATIHIFEPASERGQRGVEELQQQTVSLLSFQQMPKQVFDAQLSFNMLAQVGEQAATQLQDIEDRIERHLATLLGRMDGVPMPSLRLIQAPVFHGHSFSLWIEFEDAPALPDLEDVLRGERIDVRGADNEPPTNAGIAGQGGVALGAITPDRNNGNAVWMWMVADNLRLAAENAAMLAQEVI